MFLARHTLKRHWTLSKPLQGQFRYFPTRNQHQKLPLIFKNNTIQLSLPCHVLKPLSQTTTTIQFNLNEHEPAASLLEHLKEDIIHQTPFAKDIQIGTIPADHEQTLEPTLLEQISIVELLKQHPVFWITSQENTKMPWTLDFSPLRQQLSRLESDHQALLSEHDSLAHLSKQIHAQSHVYTRRIEILACLYLIAQLSVIVYLTYEMGWDLMEPVSYLVTLATAILAFGYACIRKHEYTYPNIHLWIKSLFANRLSKSLAFDQIRFKKVSQELALKQNQMDRLRKLIHP